MSKRKERDEATQENKTKLLGNNRKGLYARSPVRRRLPPLLLTDRPNFQPGIWIFCTTCTVSWNKNKSRSRTTFEVYYFLVILCFRRFSWCWWA
ncbi:hypothetical protein K2173_005846 [Erythroxylum novogranatense]|uniref:Ribosomal protein S14 n=1 Tax=Erythroxylum novogranatense TaxID=1862640 RepID=A0AAV8U5J9_9ROSI|nr:hypothetical protein K2173_005846 [Erythroxylum novogranatense]